MNDSEFDRLLRTTRDHVPLPSLFLHEVWQRIESAESDRCTQIANFQSIVAAFVRPWVAAASIATMVTLGLWLAAATVPDAKDSQMAYAESISPFAKTHGK